MPECDNCSCAIGPEFESKALHEVYGRRLCDYCHALLMRRGFLLPPTFTGKRGAGGDGRQEMCWIENGEWKMKRVNPLKLLAESASK